MLLSIVVPTLLSRATTYLPKCLSALEEQTQPFKDEIELIVLLDNAHMSLGRKLDELNSLARGEYVVRVEDDDEIVDDYVETIVKAIRANRGVDTITFYMSLVDKHEQLMFEYHYDIDCNKIEYDTLNKIATRPTDGKMVIRRELLDGITHPDSSYRGEDWVGSDRLLPKLETQYEIGRVLYRGFYRDDNEERKLLAIGEPCK